MIFLELFSRVLFTVIVLTLLTYVSDDMRLVTEVVPTFVRFALAGICLALALLVMRNMWYIMQNRELYERNRQATLLLRKAHAGVLTAEEADRLVNFKKTGVLTRNTNGALRLSDQAVRDIYQ